MAKKTIKNLEQKKHTLEYLDIDEVFDALNLTEEEGGYVYAKMGFISSHSDSFIGLESLFWMIRNYILCIGEGEVRCDEVCYKFEEIFGPYWKLPLKEYYVKIN